ncbi:hypothetical protein FWJ33_13600 [Leptospira interrogans serovar Hardjo]|nr:hypothetical protein FWJ33_13600 [Leptospira interrogans serovar Hardjo]
MNRRSQEGRWQIDRSRNSITLSYGSRLKLSKTLSYGSRLKLSKTLSYGSRLKLSKTLSYGSRFRLRAFLAIKFTSCNDTSGKLSKCLSKKRHLGSCCIEFLFAQIFFL